MNDINVSIIITTYNWPEALKVVLTSLLAQSYSGFEIIIADDGSSQETHTLIQTGLSSCAHRWIHVSHEDNGIRQARVKNLAVKHAKGRYLLFIDHDVALHPDFVKDHLSMTTPGCFLQGKRVFLPESLTNDILKQGYLPKINPLQIGLENRQNAFRLPKLGKLFARPHKFQTSLRGCNLSMYYDDFIRVDGYDEVFDQAWGREDSDICYRLYHSGIRVKNLRFSGIQYHLHHHVLKKRDRDVLDDELDKIIAEKRNKAVKGFSKLSDEGGIIAQS
jgi:glycosyltransferase involved in cell wall biosynthesis